MLQMWKSSITNLTKDVFICASCIRYISSVLLKCKNRTIESRNVVVERRHKDPPMAEMQLSKLTALMSVFAVCTVQKNMTVFLGVSQTNPRWLLFFASSMVFWLFGRFLWAGLSPGLCCRLRSDVSHKPCHLILI